MKTVKERALAVKESGSTAIDCAGLTDAEVDAKMLDWMAEHFAAHEADVVEAIAAYVGERLDYPVSVDVAADIRSGAWRKAGK